jgi:hypothetical protein
MEGKKKARKGDREGEREREKNKLVMVEHNYNSSYVGGVGRRIIGQGWPQVKNIRPNLKIN